MGDSFLENYDSCADTIRKLYDSRLRLSILDALQKGPMRLADLRREVDSNAPNTSAKAKDLEDMDLLERVGGDFQLTHHGKVTLQKISDEAKFYATYEKFKEFWQTHITDGMPPEFWAKIGVLSTAELVVPKPDDIDYVDKNFVRLMLQTKKRLFGMSPVFRDEYLQALIAIVLKGVDVRVILEEHILVKVLKAIPQDALLLLPMAKNLNFYVIPKGTGVGFSVGDNFTTTSFTSAKGPSTYMDMQIISHDPKSIDFHLELFNYYKAKSKPVKLKDYL